LIVVTLLVVQTLLLAGILLAVLGWLHLPEKPDSISAIGFIQPDQDQGDDT
jgi:hypothetical protein